MRQWIKQPYGKNQCGQVAVAVIAGIPLDESIKLIGKKGCTATKDLVKALRSLGFQCPDRCKQMPRPPLGIAQLHYPSRKRNRTWSANWHWVVVDGDKIFDGSSHGNPDGTTKWLRNWKMTSYLPINAGISV